MTAHEERAGPSALACSDAQKRQEGGAGDQCVGKRCEKGTEKKRLDMAKSPVECSHSSAGARFRQAETG